MHLRPDDVRAARNAVTVRIVGIGVGQNIGCRDRLQQAQSDHLGGHTRAEHCIRVQRTIAQVGGGIGRMTQRDGCAIRKGDHLFGVGDLHPCFGGMALHREILKLGAIDRIGAGGDIAFDPVDGLGIGVRDGHAQKHRNRFISGVLGRMPAAVLDVATLARPRIIERAQPVGCKGGGGRGDPDLAEEAVAQFEVELILEGDIAGGLREGIGIAARADRSGPCRIFLELLGLREIGRGCGHGSDAGRLGGCARDHVKMRIAQRRSTVLRWFLRRGSGCQNRSQRYCAIPLRPFLKH